MPRRKQRRSWGSITELRRNKKYVLRWLENTEKGYARRSRTFYGTYREACNALEVIHVKIMERGDDARIMTIGQVAERWWFPDVDDRVKSGSLKPTTAKSYRITWNAHVKDRWAEVPCDKVRQSDVQDWLDGMTYSSAASSLTLAKSIMDVAVLREEVGDNKFRAKYRMPTKGEKRTKDVLTEEEAREVLANLRGDAFEPPFILSCFGGCRVAESLAVAVDDVSFEDGGGMLFAVVAVRRQMARKGHEPREMGDMKNEQSIRTTVVPPPYSERLRELHDARSSAGSIWMADRGDGTLSSLGVASNTWHAIWEKVGVEGKWVTMQNLRPSWRTMAEGRWRIRPRILELMMGHKLPGVTGRHYFRADERLVVDAFKEDYVANNEGT